MLIRLRRPELAFHAGRSKLLPEATGDQIVCEKAQPIALAFERLVTFITATRWKCDPAPSAETDMKARERGERDHERRGGGVWRCKLHGWAGE